MSPLISIHTLGGIFFGLWYITPMLYTRKGDDGTTKTFGCANRIVKSSLVTEALGSMDEVNSFLGLCKAKSRTDEVSFLVGDKDNLVSDLVAEIQQDLFIIQAELAGADKKISASRVTFLELVTDSVEKQIPPIKSFIIPGGTELSSLFDVVRTIARRTERAVVRAQTENLVVSPEALSYLNRLSSVLYALARIANTKKGVKEENPHY